MHLYELATLDFTVNYRERGNEVLDPAEEIVGFHGVNFQELAELLVFRDSVGVEDKVDEVMTVTERNKGHSDFLFGSWRTTL